MTNQDLLRIAMSQSAEDLGCRPDDFLSDKNQPVPIINKRQCECHAACLST